MDRELRVLLLVAEAWRLDDSGGNTLNNFMEGMDDVEFAQIYTDDRMPECTCCSKFYNISRAEIFRSFLGRKKVGHELTASEIQNNNKYLLRDAEKVAIESKWHIKDSLLEFGKKLNLQSFKMFLSLVWNSSNWKTEELHKFVSDFNPDVIYAPCYASSFHLALTRYIKRITGCKVISWVADDCYSLRQFSLNPLYWINRFHIRYCLRKTFPYYDELYSISEEQADELAPIAGQKIGILRKGVFVPDSFSPREVHRPIKFIYAGGLYLNRHKSLIKIADAIRKLNTNMVRAELHIYSGSKLDNKSTSLLNDGRSSYMHGLIPSKELTKIYQDCDVAIHCESFDFKYRLMTRLSFSTKIIDCFQSGCAILAIAWKEHTGIKSLSREDAAVCVTDIDDIEKNVVRLVENPDIIREYAIRAYECEKRNHRIEDVHQRLYDAFKRNLK